MSPRPDQAIAKLTPGSRGGDDKRAQPVDPTKTGYTIERPTGAGGCLVLIGRVVSDGTFAYMDVNVPATFYDLIVQIWGSVDTHSGFTDVAYLQFNFDADLNYRWTSALFQNTIDPLTIPECDVADLDGEPGILLPFSQFSGFDYPASPGSCEMTVANYNADGFRKIADGTGGGILTNNDGSMYGGFQLKTHGQWLNNGPITTVTAACDPATWVSGSTFSVWGRC